MFNFFIKAYGIGKPFTADGKGRLLRRERNGVGVLTVYRCMPGYRSSFKQAFFAQIGSIDIGCLAILNYPDSGTLFPAAVNLLNPIIFAKNIAQLFFFNIYLRKIPALLQSLFQYSFQYYLVQLTPSKIAFLNRIPIYCPY